MNSFYDLPRRCPTNLNTQTKQIQQAAVLEVPEVSMISGTSSISSPKYAKVNDNHLSYNAWKYRNRSNNVPERTSIEDSPSVIAARKQVRFQPAKMQPPYGTPGKQFTVNGPPKNPTGYDYEDEEDEPEAPIKSLSARPIERIYMANIGGKTVPETKRCPTLPKNGLQPEYQDNLRRYREMQRDFMREEKKEQEERKETATITDLMKIIQQQNDQMSKLQAQINELMLEKTRNREEKRRKEEEESNKENRKFEKPSRPAFRKPKYSFDVMTSFEVSIRAQKFPAHKFPAPVSPLIEEITEEETVNGGSRLLFNNASGPLAIQERPVTPERSVHVDMPDYSSEEEEEEEEDDDCASSIGKSYYDNVLRQVNDILQQQKQPETDPSGNLRNIQAATFKHLRSLGINVPCQESFAEEGNGSSEVSIAVKQILMKYLPDEMLTKVVTKSKPVMESRRPEFSFATVQYLKKYNLLSSDSCGIVKNMQGVKCDNNGRDRNANGPKILDITALKRQPKFL